MAHIYISVGTNVDRDQNTRAAIAGISHFFNNLVLSSVYESESVGFNGDNFYNMVVGADSSLSVKDTVAALKQIEADNGRRRGELKFSNRTLDLDLLVYDDIITTDGVVLPRDELDKNAFVLWPMAEIAPELIHPTRGVRYVELWQQYDKNKQKLWTVPFTF